jgi:hypothetical protein
MIDDACGGRRPVPLGVMTALHVRNQGRHLSSNCRGSFDWHWGPRRVVAGVLRHEDLGPHLYTTLILPRRMRDGRGKKKPAFGEAGLVFGRQCTGDGGWAPGKNSKRPSLDLVPYFLRGLISVMYL